MSIHYTPDGYSFDTGGDWNYLRNITWQNLGEANTFMVNIGERGAPGEILPFLARLLNSDLLRFGLKLTGMVGLLSSFLLENPLVSTALARMLGEFGVSIDPKKLPALIDRAKIDLGEDQVLQHFRAPVYVSENEFSAIRSEWHALTPLKKIYVLKQFYKRLADDHGKILRSDFSSDPGLIRSVMVMMKLIPDDVGDMHPGVFSNAPKGREFWLGEGFGKHMNHCLGLSNNGGQLDNPVLHRKWNESARSIAVFDFNATQAEADNFNNMPVSESPNAQNSGAGLIGIAAGLAAIIQAMG